MGGRGREWQQLGEGQGHPMVKLLGVMAVAAAVLLVSQFSGLLGLSPLPDLVSGIFHGGGKEKKQQQQQITKKKKKKKNKKVRVYMDGCFDMMHYGHANALRQARGLGDELVVGVVSDEEIKANKGPPVMSMDERVVMVSSVKWVDEVITDAPYAINEEFMNKLFVEHNIDYIIHGDDPCLLPDGSDAYALAKKAGRYKQIKRTEGVSSTDIVGRMLLCLRDRSVGDLQTQESLQRQFGHGHSHDHERDSSSSSAGASTRISQFLPTSRRIVQFSNGKGPRPDARIVYMDGAFDLFHAGHVETLKCARELGDFLLVGIHTDQTVREEEKAYYLEAVWSTELGGSLNGKYECLNHSGHRGAHHPIMHLHERSLSVLACRYVDEVIIGAPWVVTKDMITTFNISLVVHGTCAEVNEQKNGERDPYAAAKEMGIFTVIESPRNMTTSTIIQRILTNHEAYKKRNEKKVKSEKNYYESKTFVNGD